MVLLSLIAAWFLIFLFIAAPTCALRFSSASEVVRSTSTELGAIRKLRPLKPESVKEAVDAVGGLDDEGRRRREEEVVARLSANQQVGKYRVVLLPPTFDDMKKMAFLLANVSDSLDTNPEVALSLASQNMGWLFARNVPGLAQMLLQEYPALRQDRGMMRGYMFLVDFLESISKETGNLLKKNQAAMKLLLEAMKVSEEAINEVIENSSVLKSPEFLVYLDSEIESHEPNGPMENLLVTVKLRLLEEMGKVLGYDTTILPKLASEEDPAELRRKTIAHLESYEGIGGKELFLQALRLMKKDMNKRHKAIDPILFANLGEVEKITESMVKREQQLEDERERVEGAANSFRA